MSGITGNHANGGGFKTGGSPGGNQTGGGNSGTTSYGAPIHTVTGPTYGGIQVAKSPQAWGALNDQVKTYNDAATKWNAGTGPSVGNLVNRIAPMGLSMQPPEYNKPKTYVGGDYHLGLNPASLAGGLLGGAAFPGAGLLTGPAAGSAYTAMGGQNVMLGGGQVPGAWGMNAPGGMPGGPGGPQMAQGGSGQPMGGNPTQGGGGPMSAFPQAASGGAPFGAQSGPPVSAPAPQAAPGGSAGGFFRPQLPNHTLPQGYQSLFPNSLTDQDRALLYGKALAG